MWGSGDREGLISPLPLVTFRMGQLCPDYINRTATPALFAPLMTQTSYATSEVLYLLTYLLTYLLARDSIEGLSSVKAPPLTSRLTPSP